jgi:hypothetical protein
MDRKLGNVIGNRSVAPNVQPAIGSLLDCTVRLQQPPPEQAEGRRYIMNSFSHVEPTDDEQFGLA